MKLLRLNVPKCSETEVIQTLLSYQIYEDMVYERLCPVQNYIYYIIILHIYIIIIILYIYIDRQIDRFLIYSFVWSLSISNA